MRKPIRWALLATLTLAACAPAAADSAGTAEGAVTTCRPLSELGAAVARAASAAESTTPLVVTERNRLVKGPIVGPEAYAEAMGALVRSAKREVLFEVFLLDDGWMAARLRDAIQSLDPSIPVYVLVTSDRTQNRMPNDQPAPTLEESTAERVHRILDPRHERNVIVGAWRLSGAVGTGINHDKAIVVDQERAIVSNINLELPTDPVGQGEEAQGWYQMGLELEGEVARSVAEEFRSAWSHVTAVKSTRPDGGRLTRDDKSGQTTLPAFATPPLPASVASSCLPIVSLGREVSSKDESAANAGFVALFTSARRNVNVITPNLNAKTALAALVDATKKSDVRIVVSKGFTEKLENLPGQGGGNESVVTERLPRLLAERGGDPCKLHVRYYGDTEAPGVAVYGEAIGQSHAKFASADGQVVVVGSQNMDTQSWEASRELSVALDDAPLTRRFDAEFEAVWQRGECAHECGGCRTR